MIKNLLFWLAALAIAFLAGKAVSKLKLPAILGWLVAGMLLGPNAFKLVSQETLDTFWYKTIIMWMQCAFGIMLGTELVWNKIKHYSPLALLHWYHWCLGFCSNAREFRSIWPLLLEALLLPQLLPRPFPSSMNFIRRVQLQTRFFPWLSWMILLELLYFSQ